jgi:hypothetical protein
VVGIEPHLLAAVVAPVVAADVPEAGALAGLDELDELDEQAARPRPAARAKAVKPPLDIALIYVSFDVVLRWPGAGGWWVK